MPTDAAPKILARNVAAVRRFADPARVAASVTGNPASTRLESGVGNCFPGLECDLRNLERRFLPFLEVDILDSGIRLVGVDTDGIDAARNDGTLSSEEAKAYDDLAAALAAGLAIVVTDLAGTFGILGPLSFDPRTLPVSGVSTGEGRLPSDTWTAVRLLTEGTDVEVRFEISVVGTSVTVKTRRARYLDDNGALSAAFLPGELTQSLCSPWTHDFRDCGCFYWATNHPDIVQPVYPAAGPPADPQPWQAAVPWQRLDRSRLPDPPLPATGDARPSELRHYEINQRWEELHFVVGRREITAPFVAEAVRGEPFSSLAVLLAQLHYAVGVELAVAQEYLSAAYSLKADDDPTLGGTPGLRDDVRATRAELMRIAIGEMRHTRAVNDVIRGLMPAGTYAPALRVARAVPHAGPGSYRPVQPRAATRQAITDFIEIEAPSAGVDGLYVDILETLVNPPADLRPVAIPEWSEAIGSVIAEGEDHYQTFLDIQEWLGAHPEATYLRAVNPPRPTPGQPEHDALQGSYAGVLELLHSGYAKGRFEGATEINGARAAMVRPGGLDTLAHAVAQKGFLVAFDDIADPRFAPIDPPPAPPVA